MNGQFGILGLAPGYVAAPPTEQCLSAEGMTLFLRRPSQVRLGDQVKRHYSDAIRLSSEMSFLAGRLSTRIAEFEFLEATLHEHREDLGTLLASSADFADLPVRLSVPDASLPAVTGQSYLKTLSQISKEKKRLADELNAELVDLARFHSSTEVTRPAEFERNGASATAVLSGPVGKLSEIRKELSIRFGSTPTVHVRKMMPYFSAELTAHFFPEASNEHR